MNTKTNTPAGAPGAMIQQAVGVFHTCTQRNTQMRHLTGSMPKIDAAIAATKGNQSKTSMPIVRADNLTKNKGDEVTFHLDNPIGAYPIMGSEHAEGRGTGMSYSEDKLRVNQARFPIDMGNTMTQIRSPFDMRRFGRPKAQRLMDAYIDQSILVHLAGARGYHDHKIEWTVPVDTHPKFADIMVNRVKAPTRNRHLVAGSGSVGELRANSGEMVIATTDGLSMDVVDSPAAVGRLHRAAAAPGGVRQRPGRDGQPHPRAAGRPGPVQPVRHGPRVPRVPGQRPRTCPSRQGPPAVPRRCRAVERHPDPEEPEADPLLRGRHGQVLRRLCERAGIVVRGACRVRYRIRRGACAAAGGQALAQAFGASEHSGIPFFWSEEKGDHGDKMEILIGAILGMSKIRFAVDHGDHKEYTDHGVTVLDTAVKIMKPRF